MCPLEDRPAPVAPARRFEHPDHERQDAGHESLLRRAGPVPGRRTVSLFVEARLALDADGTWAAMDPATAAASWSRYPRSGLALRLVARAQDRRVSGVWPLEGSPVVGPLPYYVGLRGLGRALPRLVIAIVTEIRRAEVIVLRLPGVIGLLAGLACRLLRRRYCVEVVGDPVDVLASGSLGGPARCLAPVVGSLMRSVVRRSSGARYVTESMLQRRYPPQRGAATVTSSDVGLGDGAFSRDSRLWHPGPVRIVTVGSQELPYKGHDVLLRALCQLRSDGVDLRAVIVGDGRLHRDLVTLAARLGLDDVVTFTGAVSDRRRLLDLLDQASVFVLPSLTEGLPRALLEAMARGLPAIGTAVGGIPELLEEGSLVPAGDPGALAVAVAALATDRLEWEAQSRRNLQVARRFHRDVLDARFSKWLRVAPDARKGGRR
jgi:glycosyltransferase involved in cell wall biosynthesis